MLPMNLQHTAMITEVQHEETIIWSTQQSCRTQTKISLWHMPSISFWPGLIHLELYKNCLKTTLLLAYENMEFSSNRYNKWQAVGWGIGTRKLKGLKLICLSILQCLSHVHVSYMAFCEKSEQNTLCWDHVHPSLCDLYQWLNWYKSFLQTVCKASANVMKTGWQSTVIPYLRAKMNFHTYFPNVLTVLQEIWYTRYPRISNQVIVSFMQISVVEVIPYIYGRNKFLSILSTFIAQFGKNSE